MGKPKRLSRLQRSEAFKAAMLDASLDAFIMINKQGRVVEWNKAAEQIFLFKREETLGLHLYDLIIPGRYKEPHIKGIQKFLETGESNIFGKRIELYAINKNHEEFPIELTVTPINLKDSFMFIAAIRDITQKRQFEEKRLLFVNELNHRVKNTLTIVQSLFQQTLKQSKEVMSVKENFLNRLFSLSAAHNVLVEQDWKDVDINDLIAKLRVLHEGPDRVKFHTHGPSYFFSSNVAINFALAFHELATNAIKYGALSSSTGCVVIRWDVVDNTIVLLWEEMGGPEVVEPKNSGFGTRMIKSAFNMIDGSFVKIDYRKHGLKCTLVIPAERVCDVNGE